VGWAPLEFDESRERIVLFGGLTAIVFPEPGPSNISAEYASPTWYPMVPWHPQYPPARVGHPMVYDSRRNRLVIFGGGGHRDMWATARSGDEPPVWVIHPAPEKHVLPGSTFTLAAETTNPPTQPGSNPDRLQWRRNGIDLEDGPSALGTIAGAQSPHLVVAGATFEASGVYDCVATNDCGQSVSTPSVVSVHCRADLSTGAIPGQPGYGQPDGRVTNDDFFYYLAAFAAGNLGVADLTTTGAPLPGTPGHGVPDGRLDTDDFITFLTWFGSMC
jgi:hypothetical protein